ISHSWNFSAVMASKSNVGIDIQRYVDKISRLEHKFLSNKEKDQLTAIHKLELLHIYWGAKEAVFKAYGRKQVSFKDHIYIHPLDYSSNGGKFKVSFNKDINMEFEANYKIIGDYFLVYLMEQ
ncbi:MAG: 4'-phosphopantetheinyl transferase superfamily protein, partial [Bacteroidota bacterium]